MGDVVAVTPLIHAVRKRLPAARLAVLVDERNAPLLQFENNIDALYSVSTARLGSVLKTIAAMRKHACDLVVCASPGVRNSLTALLAGRRLVSGYLLHHGADTSFFNDFHAVAIGSGRTSFYPKQAHLTMRALNALAPLYPDVCSAEPRVRLRLAPAAEQEKISLLQAAGFLRPGKVNLVVHPCASWVCKQWPAEKMICLLLQLVQLHADKLHITLIGLASEKNLLETIAQSGPNRLMLLIDADLLTVMTLIKNADAFLGNDSGPKHLADAFNKPLVELLGPSLAETVGGRNRQAHSVSAQVRCSPCAHLHCEYDGLCMKSISVESVLRPLCAIIERGIKNIEVSR